MSIVIETRNRGRASKVELPLGDTELSEALGRLDGDQTTTVAVSVSGNKLIIGGGDEARYYTVTVFLDGAPFSLVGDRQATGDKMMVMGGQLIPQPRQYLVGPVKALSVAQYFARTGLLDKNESWDQP
jgi:hypothetical protein